MKGQIGARHGQRKLCLDISETASTKLLQVDVDAVVILEHREQRN